MKRLTLLRTALVLATVFTMGYTRASEPPVAGAEASNATLERALDKQLSKHISFPLLRNTNMTGEVYVSFVVNKEGKLEVISATSTNDELCAYVRRKLALVDIGENPDGTWRTEHVRFTFGPEGSI
ncbi:MAG: hypothetical protein IPI55_09040 [Flavobacteriales bacterium]|nr:hypothetical protein [Flavobacteriales bacterium]